MLLFGCVLPFIANVHYVCLYFLFGAVDLKQFYSFILLHTHNSIQNKVFNLKSGSLKGLNLRLSVVHKFKHSTAQRKSFQKSLNAKLHMFLIEQNINLKLHLAPSQP